MTKMFFSVCTVIICFLLLCSCNKEPLMGSDEWEEQQRNNFYDYKVENRDGFDMLSITQCGYNEDTTFLTGIKNEKHWIGMFDAQTKKQLREWNGTETINRKITIDKGYGETEVFDVSAFNLQNDIHKTNWGFASALSYIHREGWLSDTNQFPAKDVVSKDVILLNGNRLIVYHTNENYGLLANWFQNSVICLQPRNNNIVLSPEGKEVTTLKEIPANKKWYINLVPVSYTEDIGLIQAGISPSNEEFGQYTRIRKRNRVITQDIWSTDVPSLKSLESDARVNATILEQGNPIWKYRIDVTNRDGSKQQVLFTVNVETGELTEI